MSSLTKIQWCDGTVNPMMGCDGCELFPTPQQLARTAAIALHEQLGVLPPDAGALIDQEILSRTSTATYHARREICATLLRGAFSNQEASAKAVKELARSIANEFRCYAAILHLRHGKDATQPLKRTNPGYARIFEEPKRFPGRIGMAARLSDLRGARRPGKPWLGGFPRLIFVSDMGDALSRDIDFEYLLQEIIANVESAAGCRHIWLWLTKRPRRMVEFSIWLESRGYRWPGNLVAMTSVTSAKTVSRVRELQRVRCRLRGLSVEPLWASVNLPLQGVDWVIVGGESGAGAKLFDIEWARQIRTQCRASGTAFFLKQLGANPVDGKGRLNLQDGHGGDWDEWPDDLRVREIPNAFQHPIMKSNKIQANRAPLTTPTITSNDPPTCDSQGSASMNTADSTPLTPEENQRLAEHEETIRHGMGCFIAVGRALLEIRDQKLYRGNSRTFEEFALTKFEIFKAHAHRLIASVKVVDNLSPIGDVSSLTESCLRPLTKLEADQQREVWAQVTARTGGGRPTAKLVNKVVHALFPVPRKQHRSGGEAAQGSPMRTTATTSEVESARRTGDSSPTAVTRSESGFGCVSTCQDRTDENAQAGTGETTDEEDFALADGTTMPFSVWIHGLLPVDRIRNQLRGVRGSRNDLSAEQIAGITYQQKLIVALAAAINRHGIPGPIRDLRQEADGQMSAACKALKSIVSDAIDEAACRLGNVLRTLPDISKNDMESSN